MKPDLVDRIYESAFVPECWPGVLDDLADVAGARAGFLFVSRDGIHNWTSSTQIGIEALGPLVKSGWVARSERFSRLTSRRHSGFLTDRDIFEPEELGTDPFYRDVLYPRGLGWAAGTSVQLPSGDLFTMSVEREFARGPVEDDRIAVLDALRPHIARAAMMSTRMQLERASTISETLGAIGLAAAVLDEGGVVLATNPALEALTGHLRWRTFGRMTLIDKTADKLLRQALERIEVNSGGQVRSFLVRGAGDDPPLVAHIVPVRLSARDVFIRSAAVVVLTPISLPEAAPVELVQSLFDLTPAEARVARNLARGKTVDEIAADGEVTVHTVRAKVRGVLEKTGCTRQVEIVAMLTAISATMRVADTNGI